MLDEKRIEKVAKMLHFGIYEEAFRGKERGRFTLSRDQLKQALGVKKLHASRIERLQEQCASIGLTLIDADSFFPCVETQVLERYRRPTSEVFAAVMVEYLGEEDESDDPIADEDDEG